MMQVIITAAGLAHAAELGAEVENIASVEYSLGSTTLSTTAGPAIFTIEAARTPSTVTFFRYSPAAPDAQNTPINGSDYLQGETFTPLSAPVLIGGETLTFPGAQPLVSTETFFAGEPVFVQVEDLGQNGDPDRIETVNVTLSSGVGDEIILRLYETGPNTGVFFGFVQSTRDAPNTTDNLLSVDGAFSIDAVYQDPFDSTEISTDAAGVDPYGRIFDSVTGELLDGATVTVVDARTGEPAPVFGIDGVSPYPSTVVTGQTVTDDSGMVYELGPGEFLFPVMFPGDYRLVVIPPEFYTAPSTTPEEFFADLDNAPFDIAPASYGEEFILDGTADVSIDIPLDPETDIVVLKTASSPTGAVGDFIRYTITVENRAPTAARALLRDEMPRGFRFQAESARLNQAPFNAVTISDNGTDLSFDAGMIGSGELMTFAYVAEITGGAPDGDAVNRAFVVNLAGQTTSNIAEASIEIRDDFLRNVLTIAGRIVGTGCEDTDEEIGVAGVRLYLETGAYTVSDEDGLYHFEAVEPKTHVVQLDKTTIPEGYEIVQCEDNTRFAGRASSQFVDAQGGGVWRANFYLRPTGERPQADNQEETADAPFNDATEYLDFDQTWLNVQTPETAWAYPAPATAPTIRSVNIGVKHAGGSRAKLLINGQDSKAVFFDGRDVSKSRKVALSRWRGVQLVDGDNLIEAIITTDDGVEIERLSQTISFITDVERVEYLPTASMLDADGATTPTIAVRVTDARGRPVHRGRVIEVSVAPPYRAKEVSSREADFALLSPKSSVSTATVGQNGIAEIELEPTLETGRARVAIPLVNGRQEEISAVLRPAQREWIVVGLAEGGLSAPKTTGGDTPTARDLLREGRVAVFAKGSVGDGWLITAAGDTDKSRGDEDDELFDVIDPDDRYPLYGDRSDQGFEAQSRYPVYLKAEKGGFRGVFGDYNTDLADAKLGRYNRRFSGLQTTLDTERLSVTAFAADTNQSFVKDEIAADGTSGPYRLSAAPLVRNSETIIIETRDRFRPDIVVATIPMTRYLDYDIDFTTGEIIFRLPTPAFDAALNNNIIVIDYETSAPRERNIVAGGRVGLRVLDSRGEIGATFIHEDGAPAQDIGQADLAAVDFRYDVTDTTGLRLEYGGSRRRVEGEWENADAILAEIDHTSENLQASAYYRDTEEGFGLAQQNSATTGVRRYGVKGAYRFDTFAAGVGTVAGERFIEGEFYREENLTTGATRSVAEASLRQESNSTSGKIGIRRVVENTADDITRRTLLLVAEARQQFSELGLTLRAGRDQRLTGSRESALYPQRTTFGVDQRLFDNRVTLSATHEILENDVGTTSNTTIGATANLWKGGSLSASADNVTQDSARRLGATFGVDQEVQISDKWSTSLGVTRRENFINDAITGPVDDIAPDDPISPQEFSGDYTSVYLGAGYSGQSTTGSVRGEVRKSEDGERYTGVAGAAREVSETLSFAAAGRYTQEINVATPDTKSADLRFGAAWRPRKSDGLIIFDRLDVSAEEIDGDLRAWKAVNNLALNAMATKRLQIALNHGLKYSVLETGEDRYSGFSQLIGGEARYDITRNVDIGIHGAALVSHNSGTVDYAFGPSIGFTPAENIWLSFGWNIEGFVDEDFEGAEYTREGPFLKLRIKFDQDDASGLLNRIIPGADE